MEEKPTPIEQVGEEKKETEVKIQPSDLQVIKESVEETKKVLGEVQSVKSLYEKELLRQSEERQALEKAKPTEQEVKAKQEAEQKELKAKTEAEKKEKEEQKEFQQQVVDGINGVTFDTSSLEKKLDSLNENLETLTTIAKESPKSESVILGNYANMSIIFCVWVVLVIVILYRLFIRWWGHLL
ncbi:hypothetical protein P4K71_26440 [Bacillus cereus]|uniref:hypothetical protein n=1 Tax=Bacillus cereus TaxID=1396 RepID=UPI002DB65B59|nr:hypothetical protein [Bacillus cereus]MEB9926283.1 hypothetical protein [Bacillus cereus]MEB9986882.1 hypothetical protein [Bacillus cereus]MEB9992066.1 hypothetical protein [Bacillus cereus]MEC3114723.1 hypothetical protein [Bacillus cereus]